MNLVKEEMNDLARELVLIESVLSHRPQSKEALELLNALHDRIDLLVEMRDKDVRGKSLRKS